MTDQLQQPAWHWQRLAELAAALTPSGTIGDGMVAEMKRCGLVVLNDPLPMVLHCPKCGVQHIDEPDAAKGWTNPPHRSHECQRCGTIWRPSDLPTTGVEAIATVGKADTWTVGEGVTLNGLRALAAMQLERAIHECQNVPLHERGDYLAGVMAKVAGALFLREPRGVREICDNGPAQA